MPYNELQGMAVRGDQTQTLWIRRRPPTKLGLKMERRMQARLPTVHDPRKQAYLLR